MLAATTLVPGRLGAPRPEPHHGSRGPRLVWNELKCLLGSRALQARPACDLRPARHLLPLREPPTPAGFTSRRGDREQRAKVRERVSAEVSPFPRRGGAHDSLSPRRLRPPLTSPELQARHVPRRPRPRRPPHTARTSICGQGRIPTRGKPGARCGRLRSQNCCARWGHLVLLAAAPDTATPPRFPRGAASDLPALLRQARLGLPTGMPGPSVPCEGQGLSRQSVVPQNQQQARGPSAEPSTARRWPRASAGRWWSCMLALGTRPSHRRRGILLLPPSPAQLPHSSQPGRTSNPPSVPCSCPLCQGPGLGRCRHERSVSRCVRHTRHWPPLR